MNYVAIFHANLNYAFLIPESYERVIRSSYEVIIDGFAKHPDAKYIFEASGYTIEQMAKITPDVLRKLKKAVAEGRCEFMGAPYSHPIMANIPEEDGYWSCEFAQRVYEKHLGRRADSFWNPECTWMQYVPNAFKRAGVKYLTLDFESYMCCSDKDYSWTERNRTHDMNWGGHLPWFELDPDCKFLHRPFKNIVPGLDGFCRSDRLVGKYLSYFRGNTTIEEYISNMIHWSGRKKQGATIIVADDAEYCGTTGYYFIKYKADYTKTFMSDPTAAPKLDVMIKEILNVGPMMTFTEACTRIKPVEEPFFVEDRFAWHRTFADAWGNTPEARAWEPILQQIRDEYKSKYQPIVESDANRMKFKQLVEEFWFHMTNSANSDGRWPPPPRVTCEFNRNWVLNEIASTRKALAKIAKAVKGIPLPKQKELVVPGAKDWRYGYHFTDKDPADIAHLNIYELQHAVYHYHKMIDSDNTEKVAYGRKMLAKVFDEFDRRKMKGVRPGSIAKKKK